MIDMIDVQVIDNFLSPSYFNKLKKKVLYDPNEPPLSWSYLDSITYDREEEDLSTYGFEHVIVSNKFIVDEEMFLFLSGFYNLLIDTVNCSQILRSRFDMTLYSPNKKRQSPHVDLFFPHIASVFYLTDSDAETILYDKKTLDYEELMAITDLDYRNIEIKKIIHPKENRILIFDGSYIHTGHSPSKYKNRVILNTDIR